MNVDKQYKFIYFKLFYTSHLSRVHLINSYPDEVSRRSRLNLAFWKSHGVIDDGMAESIVYEMDSRNFALKLIWEGLYFWYKFEQLGKWRRIYKTSWISRVNNFTILQAHLERWKPRFKAIFMSFSWGIINFNFLMEKVI